MTSRERLLRLALHMALGAALTLPLGCTEPAPPSVPEGFVQEPPDDPNNAPDDPEARPSSLVFLSPVDHLVRASMALRGVRPSIGDIEAVEADPEAIEDIVDDYLGSSKFGETIRDMHDTQWLLRTFLFTFAPRGEYADMEMSRFNASIQDAPLRLIEHVVMNDRPYSEIVTADYTLADEFVATVWGMDYDGDGAEWVETRYPDAGRPHAGILTDSMLYVRHYSTPLNAQRSRANAISKSLLCFDFLARDIDVSGNVDLSDPEAVKNAVRSPACASCHQTLDPLANLFWTFEYFIFPSQSQTYPITTWRPEYDRQHRPAFTDRGKGYFGLPAENLEDLGERIAEDPRFAQCTARRFYAHLAHVNMNDVPFELLADFQKVFEDSDMSAKALARAIVLSDAFRTSHATDERDAADLVGLKKVRPRQLSRMMNDLTGFTWTLFLEFSLFAENGVTAPYGTVDLMRDHLFGYEVVAGGRDDFVVTRGVDTINPTMSLVYQNFATEAAGFVVDRDFNGEGPVAVKRLLTEVDETDTDEDVVRDQLAALHLRLFAEKVSPDGDEVDLSYGLFEAALDHSDDVRRAWKTTLGAMLQDSKLLYY